MVELNDYQLKAIYQLKNGSILCGGVGTGKSRTALGYYYILECQGQIKINGEGKYAPMRTPKDLYIITTAKKRDSLEWDKECANYILNKDPSKSESGVRVTVDSWNNIEKYKKVYGAFFIFDEQRVVGSGPWVKAFLNITRKNHWILLSATPGDKWIDYVPVFVANGYYRNRTDFKAQHCIMNSYSSYPKIDRYVNEKKLNRIRSEIVVQMDSMRNTVRHDILVKTEYDRELYRTVFRDRWNPYEQKPIEHTPEVFYLIRRVVNSDSSRIEKAKDLMEKSCCSIIFYNFNYELELLREACDELTMPYKEWNGSKHEELPVGERWVYLVQYSAGCEGWNCTTSNTVIFYSQSYSYRQTEQAAGRIDRMNTPFKDLYYYHLRSSAPIDLAINRALSQKKNFNESAFIKKDKNNE